MAAHASWGRIAVFALLGVALVSNPLFLYPDGGGEDTMTYRVEGISNETIARQALGVDRRVLECPAERPCAVEERVLEEGAVSYDGHVQRGQSYPVVAIDGDWYLPTTDVDNGTAVLTLEAVSPTKAVEHAAVPAAERRPEVREGIRTGSVTVHGDRIEAFERNWIVSDDGRYYWNSGFRYRSGGTALHGTGLLVVRCVLSALGVASLVVAGWHLRARSDRPDRE